MSDRRGGVISSVLPGSPAWDAGIRPGDTLLRINGHHIRDEIDYLYFSADPELDLDIERKDGHVARIHIGSPSGPLGLGFDSPIFDGIKTCRNRCIFCFIDQLPRGLRSSLYLKDDDYRLSFLHGNFITLTNMTEEDLERIISFRLSPLYVSVHTTSGDLRSRMMGNPGASKILEQLRRLAGGGIELHIQIVACPGINDGEELDRTISDLVELFPGVRSCAVVPVGLTAHRQGLMEIHPYTETTARALLHQVRGWQDKLREELGTRFVFAADEFYIKAGADIPPASSYEGYPQRENGVGLVRIFEDEFARAVRRLGGSRAHPRHLSLATGVLMAERLNSMMEPLRQRGLRVDVIPVPNNLLGPQVSVAGLLSGRDIISAAKEHTLGDELLIPQVALREGTDLFLDDVSVRDVARELGVPVRPVRVSGQALVRAVWGGARYARARRGHNRAAQRG